VNYPARYTRIVRTIGLLLLSEVVGIAGAYGVFRGLKGWDGLMAGMAVGLGIIVPIHVMGFVRLGKARPTVSLDFTPGVGAAP